MRLWVIEQNQICKHLDGAIGDMSGQEGVLKGSILETEKYTAFFCCFRINTRDTGHSLLQLFDNLVENWSMSLVQKLSHK